MAGTLINGTLELHIDALELEARLAFSPDKAGAGWNADGVLKLLGEKRISPLPSPRIIEELLQKFARSKERVALEIVRGIPPEAPTPERVAWADAPVPEDLTALATEKVDKAGPPVIERVRVEKTKRETVVKKPGALPFLPQKEEIVVSWDKKETKERVFVDPKVEDLAYAEAGQKIGTIAPPKPGKPGKSIFGKSVAPQSDGDGLFLIGEGIEREKSELKAKAAGVVRIGQNWADIVPLARPRWKIEKGVDQATVFLSFWPGDRKLSAPPAADLLAEAADLVDDPSLLIDEKDLDTVLEQANRTSETVQAFPLSRRQDAEARVDISADGLQATLFLRKGIAGATPLELRAVSEAIKASKVHGFKAEQVKADILAFFKGPQTELRDYELVEGKAPTRGKDRDIQVFVAFLTEQRRAEVVARIAANPSAFADPDASFPPALATDAAFVEKEARVAAVTQPPAGNSGVDVYGNALPGLPGNDPDIHLLNGLRQAKNEIFAELAGVLLVKRQGGSFSGYVVPYRDSAIEVVVSGDLMEATLELVRSEGAGIPLGSEAVSAALAAAGVKTGIDSAAIAAALLEANEKGRFGPVAVARGEKPVTGGGASIKWLVHLASGKGVTVKNDGRADFKNQDRFVSVGEGEGLAEIIRQGVEGKAGFDVSGKAIDAQKGETASLEHDDSVREELIENGVRLVAIRAGELIYDGKSVRVNALHLVKGDIGTATGNVNFNGEVRISGKVNPGFAVIGGGDVLIGETAESALVSSGGKVVIGQGIIGAGKGIVRARLGIDAAFVEQATLLAVEDIRVKNGCLQSHIKTNGKLQLIGEKGNLIGGYCKARHGVESMNIGSERGTRTEISFGQDYLVKDQIEVSEREIEKLQKALADLERKTKELEARGAPLDAARAEKIRLMKLLEKQSLRLFTLREKFEEHHQSEVRVRGTIQPGVVMESHGRYYEVKQKRSQVVFSFDREVGRIQEKPLGK